MSSAAGWLLAGGLEGQDTGGAAAEIFVRAMEAYRSGEHLVAARGFESAARLRPHNPRWAFNAAIARARADDPSADGPSAAVRWLHRVADLGAAFPLDSDAFDPLRARPEFRAVERRFEAIREPVVTGGVAFTLDQRDLMPESIAFDPVAGIFYLGSMFRRKIVRFRPGEEPRDFVREGEYGLWSVLGMKLDAERRQLWVNACNLGEDLPMAVPEPETVGRTAVFSFDLETGGLLRRHDPSPRDRELCFNDLVLGPDGGAYVSAGGDGVFRIQPSSDAIRPYIRAPALQVNGLDLSEDGRTLYLTNGPLGVYRADLQTGEVRRVGMPADVTLNGIDGLYAYDGSLVGVQNGHTPQRVVQAFLNPAGDSVTSLRVIESNRPEWAGPTTGAVVGDSLYYVGTSQLFQAFDENGEPVPWEQLRDVVILRSPLTTRP